MSKNPGFPSEQVDEVRAVVQEASSVLQTAYERISGGCIDMPAADKRVLKMASGRSDIILREIREVLGVPNSTLTGAVDRLEERGLLRRVVSRRDRRSYGLELTDGGRAYMALQEQAEHDFAVRVLEILETDEERQAFIDILSKVVSGLA